MTHKQTLTTALALASAATKRNTKFMTDRINEMRQLLEGQFTYDGLHRMTK